MRRFYGARRWPPSPLECRLFLVSFRVVLGSIVGYRTVLVAPDCVPLLFVFLGEGGDPPGLLSCPPFLCSQDTTSQRHGGHTGPRNVSICVCARLSTKAKEFFSASTQGEYQKRPGEKREKKNGSRRYTGKDKPAHVCKYIIGGKKIKDFKEK